MEARPKPKIPLSSTDKVLEIIGWICLGILWIITLASYTHLPEIIPTHFNMAGQVDDQGDKMMILLLPLIGTLMFIGMTILQRYPHRFNYPSVITEENAPIQYQNATRMIRVLKLAVAIVFSMIVFMIYRSATGSSGDLQRWFLPVMLALILLPLSYFTIKALKAR